jgi:hypothetical protein
VYDPKENEIAFVVYAFENYSLLATADGRPIGDPYHIPSQDQEEVYYDILAGEENRFALLWIDNHPSVARIMIFPSHFVIENEVVIEKPENEQKGIGTILFTTFTIPLVGTPHDVGICTDALLERFKFVHENRRLYLQLSGYEENFGMLVVAFRKELSRPENIKVYLDNRPAEFEIIDPASYLLEGYDYAIQLDFGLSSRLFMIDFTIVGKSSAPPVLGVQPSWVIGTVLALITLGVLCWLKFRR